MTGKKLIKDILKTFGLYKEYSIDASIKKYFVYPDENSLSAVRESLVKNFFAQKKFTQEIDSAELEEHMFHRIEKFRSCHVPFLSSLRSIRGLRILEIGCGTGSSSVALAEQGAIVTGIDIDSGGLQVAHDRMKAYGLHATFLEMNATDLKEILGDQHFDIVIFFASIEHMTYEEQLLSMKQAWDMLEPGSLWCLFGTPNRLWHFDSHTSLLPFYQWLPNHVAFDYSRFSSRKDFNNLYKKKYDASKVELARWGRGISYHEIELAIKPMQELKVIGNINDFMRQYSWLQKISFHRSDEWHTIQFLKKHGPPGIHQAFCEIYLDLAIVKN